MEKKISSISDENNEILVKNKKINFLKETTKRKREKFKINICLMILYTKHEKVLKENWMSNHVKKNKKMTKNK